MLDCVLDVVGRDLDLDADAVVGELLDLSSHAGHSASTLQGWDLAPPDEAWRERSSSTAPMTRERPQRAALAAGVLTAAVRVRAARGRERLSRRLVLRLEGLSDPFRAASCCCSRSSSICSSNFVTSLSRLSCSRSSGVDISAEYPPLYPVNPAGVAELADAPGLGPGGLCPWRFESSHPHSPERGMPGPPGFRTIVRRGRRCRLSRGLLGADQPGARARLAARGRARGAQPSVAASPAPRVVVTEREFGAIELTAVWFFSVAATLGPLLLYLLASRTS